MSSKKLSIEGKDFVQVDIAQIRREVKKTAPLTTFAFQQASPGEHWVTISSPELTCICPFSDYPDFGTVTITYVPDKKCLELKSFKLYINAFREVKIFHESITELIFADFLEVVKPKKARLIIDMNARGNVKTVCEKSYRCVR
ncbi:MAG: preQ(1) synthase [bacterium]|nr:preQ(1) synthase [bacterium]